MIMQRFFCLILTPREAGTKILMKGIGVCMSFRKMWKIIIILIRLSLFNIRGRRFTAKRIRLRAEQFLAFTKTILDLQSTVLHYWLSYRVNTRVTLKMIVLRLGYGLGANCTHLINQSITASSRKAIVLPKNLTELDPTNSSYPSRMSFYTLAALAYFFSYFNLIIYPPAILPSSQNWEKARREWQFRLEGNGERCKGDAEVPFKGWVSSSQRAHSSIEYIQSWEIWKLCYN